MIITRKIHLEKSRLDLLDLQQRVARGELRPEEVLPAYLKKRTTPPHEEQLDKWVTNDPDMLRIKDRLRSLVLHFYGCDKPRPVLFTGPTGTGKEVLARVLQLQDAPFVAVNCGGIAPTLIHSTFFGHVKGAFTGANESRDGILVQAKNGVVFLDEIAELPLELQATLLRALQENEIYPVGSVTPRPIQCRFIAATKHDLRELVSRNAFREDLFARLYTFEFRLSPLHARPNDIPLIAKALGWTEPLPLEPDSPLYKDITLFNVRAIETYIARMKAYGHY